MEQLTLHRVLSELKTIDSRINKATEELIPRAVKRGNILIVNGRNSNETINDFTDRVKADYQSVTDLIKRKFALKAALLKANSTTTVVIADKSYTIAEAIEMKSQATLRRSLITRMKRVNNSVDTTFDSTTTKVEDDFERLLAPQISGLTNKSDIAKVREEFRATYLKSNDVALVDPINSDEEAKRLENELDQFLVNVDSALSEINAITVVEIE